jgi:DNA-binding NtrC family response regulator
MVRPCFLVVDPEHSGSISTRKLVIETAKLNVITAYSGAEALETVKKFSAVDGIVCNTEVRDMPLGQLIAECKAVNPRLPVVVIGPDFGDLSAADYRIESFDPKRLLEVLQGLTPAKVTAIMKHELELHERELRDGEEKRGSKD